MASSGGLARHWDYRRERFTMDEGYVRAVLKYFVHCTTAVCCIATPHRQLVSALRERDLDLEVNHTEVDDQLFTIRYPLADGSGHLTIATVRPRPCSPTSPLPSIRRRPLPASCRERGDRPCRGPACPIIADDRVDPELNGAAQITPGHDPMDFEIGRTHGLPELTVIGLDGSMNETTGELAGLTQAEAEKRIVAIFATATSSSRPSLPYAVGHCDRCGSRIEPLITLQWWCEMTELAAPAIDAVRDGCSFRPERYTKVYLDWMESIRPWCVSRQLWWGHRIPVWYCRRPPDRPEVRAGGVCRVRLGGAAAG